MPAFSTISVPDLLGATQTLYTNARDTPEIVEALGRYKITPAMLDGGLALRSALVEAMEDQAAETADARRATTAVRAAVAEVREELTIDRELARLDHPRGSDGYLALALAGSPPDDRDELLAMARTFYATLAERPELAEPVASLSPESVATARALVEVAEAADTAQDKEVGEAQRATKTRETAVATLRSHASRTAAVATRALADAPQLRELLGLLERS